MNWRIAALIDRLTKGKTMTETATALAKGVDYSESHPSIAALKAGGYTFVVRYLSLTSAKNLTPPERDALLGAGIKIALVWETTAGRMLGGRDAGKQDGLKADAEATALKMTGIPLYFACDFDATEGQQTLINAYLDGVADRIGRDRTGIYGGYWPVSRALSAGKATWAWQTYAWSTFNPAIPMPAHAVKWQIGTHTYFADTRAQLRQGPNGINVGGADVDLDHAYAADFGQWPRPRIILPGKHVCDGSLSMREIARTASTTVPAIWFATVLGKAAEGEHGFGALERDYLYAGNWDAKLTAGTIVWLP